MNKLTDFADATAEMQHFELRPPAIVAAMVIGLELGASAMILTGRKRWIGALLLAGFTLAATFVANCFWQIARTERFAAPNSFFERLGLVGGFVLVVWHDIRQRQLQRSKAPVDRPSPMHAANQPWTLLASRSRASLWRSGDTS